MAGGTVRWTGFAELRFEGSAGLAFARAVEQAATDVHLELPDAWVVEDRRVTFSAEVEGGPQLLEGTKRLLRALALQAVAGDVALEIAQPFERWVLRAAPPSSSKELAVGDEPPDGETIRTAAS
ncbi:MAG TPA: hypothetical protein VHB21_08110 [Minicystis sp.]|nr:hypothetical protein [Minicystis sp.]